MIKHLKPHPKWRVRIYQIKDIFKRKNVRTIDGVVYITPGVYENIDGRRIRL